MPTLLDFPRAVLDRREWRAALIALTEGLGGDARVWARVHPGARADLADLADETRAPGERLLLRLAHALINDTRVALPVGDLVDADDDSLRTALDVIAIMRRRPIPD